MFFLSPPIDIGFDDWKRSDFDELSVPHTTVNNATVCGDLLTPLINATERGAQY